MSGLVGLFEVLVSRFRLHLSRTGTGAEVWSLWIVSVQSMGVTHFHLSQTGSGAKVRSCELFEEHGCRVPPSVTNRLRCQGPEL